MTFRCYSCGSMYRSPCDRPHRTHTGGMGHEQLRSIDSLVMYPPRSLPIHAVNRFQKIPPQKTTLDYMNRQASKLFDVYIRQGSADQVPFTRDILCSIFLSLESNLSPLLFNPAQSYVEELLRDEVYPQFLSSESCANLRKDVLAQKVGVGSEAEEMAREKQERIIQLRQVSLGKSGGNQPASTIKKEAKVGAKQSGRAQNSQSRGKRPARDALMSVRRTYVLTYLSCLFLFSLPSASLVSTFGTMTPVLLFSDLLQDSLLLGLFREFLVSNFALESFLFYLEVQQFKIMPQSDFMKTIANKMYAKYVKQGAKMKITYLTEEIRGATPTHTRRRARRSNESIVASMLTRSNRRPVAVFFPLFVSCHRRWSVFRRWSNECPLLVR
jgi:hypothetical protein